MVDIAGADGQRGSKSARTRQRVLDAAAEVFSKRGYAGTRLSDIAQAAQIRAGSLYYHFASKDDLVEEVLRAGVRATQAHVQIAVEELPADASPGDRLREAVAAHAEAVLEAVNYSSANVRIIGQVPAEVRKRHFRDQRRYGDYWAGLFRAARATGEIREDVDLLMVRMLIIGALNWSVEWPVSLRRSPTAVASTLNLLLFEGLRPRSTDAEPRSGKSAHRSPATTPIAPSTDDSCRTGMAAS